MAGLITEVSPKDFGYHKVFLRKSENLRYIRELSGSYGYNFTGKNSDLYIRRIGRGVGETRARFLEIVSELDQTTYRDKSKYAFLAPYSRTGAATTEGGYFKHASVSEVTKGFPFSSNSLVEKFHLNIRRLMFWVEQSGLQNLLEEHILPYFFNEFNGAEVTVFKYNVDEFETISAFFRMGYALNFIEETDYPSLERTGFPLLRDWQGHQLQDFIGATIGSYLLSFFPNVYLLPVYRFGLAFLFRFREPVKITEMESKNYVDYFRFGVSFGSEKYQVTSAAQFATDRIKFKRFIADGVSENLFKDSLKHYLDCLDAFFFNLSDVGTYVPNNEQVDFKEVYEGLLSINRVILQVYNCQILTEPSVQKIVTFEVADLLEEIYKSLKDDTIQSTEHFKLLFNPTEGGQMLDRALQVATIPNDYKTYFSQQFHRIYGELRSKVRDGIWMPGAFVAADNSVNVLSQNLSTKAPMPLDSYVANLVRALRNAHHGFFDERERPARFLFCSSGNIPDSIAWLPWAWLAKIIMTDDLMNRSSWNRFDTLPE